MLILLGGAARGSFTRLDGDAESFEEHYTPLRDFVRWAGLDGVDLDVEEGVSLAGMVRLVMRLRRDFGVRFLITAAPVASALLEMAGPPIDFRKGMRVPESREEVEWRTRVGNMSGFSYQDLEKAVGGEIAWYNAQFYCGWGSLMDGGMMYCAVLARGGWDPRRIVVGTVTNPWNGAGWTSERLVRRSLRCMVGAADDEAGRFCGKEAGGVMFGGMMGWEYFNCVVARDDRGLGLRSGEPWLWAERMRTLMDAAVSGDTALLEESWDEKAAVWTGRFLEGGFGGSSTTMQDKKGRWIAV